MDIYLIVSLLILGAVTGLFAGLFGIGGGGVMVPVLTFLFLRQQFPADHVVHLALATSMATIVPTALASLRAHHQHNAVVWPVVLRITPGVLVGTFAGTFLAAYLSVQFLAVFFSIFMAFVAWQMIRNLQVSPARQLPGNLPLVAVGIAIGAISALVAIGGGTLTVPFLVWCNLALPVAIGTSAAVGLPIAASGALGYWINGLGVADLPDYTLGYIYWPAVLVMACASFITAPLGARLAHRLPIPTLKKGFALLLVALSVQMLLAVFSAQ
ncbi:sulfite exporter TauE/SafE family protein [Cellvibrio japonicus]|uniref:Probable membrane transporter protein n=1 Tax=Cellvibrio japonicus (strain Ueda107) TaxID=498211 RepID=B3PHS1_CELJU|nr:sulfite exporter TauE/SafE family protein [Cellvibrio japonicus]ACE86142.1 putative membrane protein [Cellvibrio japonicus Ueda107]QEI13867.1 sulfite exporter TauE/SafE family protein [Cellvibrio japonicus]QEI17441.1 sulfite exporter TauE/SafE family protein [Cellvibrio japonicus]QEI21017.1 sulfite exporter TauE/SafE family protein [Cellvibrio japonicus]